MKIIVFSYGKHDAVWHVDVQLTERTHEYWLGEVGEFGRSGEACYVKLKDRYNKAPAFFTAKENIIFEEPGSRWDANKKYLSFDEAVEKFKLIKEGV